MLQTLFENDDFDVMILTLLAKIKRLEREVKELAMLRRVVGGGMTKSFADNNYLRRDGSRAMTGDFNAGSQNLINVNDIRAPSVGAILEIADVNGAHTVSVKVYRFLADAFDARSGDFKMRTYPSATNKLIFDGWTGAAWETQMQISRTLGVQIDRAGDITMLTGKILSGLGDVRAPNLPLADPSDGLSKLWNNGGVVTVGT